MNDFLSLPYEIQCQSLSSLDYKQVVALEKSASYLRDLVRDCLTNLISTDKEVVYVPAEVILRYPRLKHVDLSYYIRVENEEELLALATQTQLDKMRLSIYTRPWDEFDNLIKLFFDNFSAKGDFFVKIEDISSTLSDIIVSRRNGLINLEFSPIISQTLAEPAALITYLDSKVGKIVAYTGQFYQEIAEALASLDNLKYLEYERYDEIDDLLTVLNNPSLAIIETRYYASDDNIINILDEDGFSYAQIKQYIPLPASFYKNNLDVLLRVFPNLIVANVIVDEEEEIDKLIEMFEQNRFNYWKLWSATQISDIFYELELIEDNTSF